MSLRPLLNPTDEDDGDDWTDDMRRFIVDGTRVLNPSEDHLDSIVYPTDMSFNHSFGDQDLIFVDQLEHIPGLEATPFDQASFLQPVPDDVGLSGTSMTSTPGVDFTDGPVGNVDVSMVDVASSEQGKQVCYGMLVHEKVKLVGKGQELETKILALKDNNQHIHTLSIQPSGDGSLFLRFPDGTDLGYLSRKMEQALEALICLPLFEIDALTNLNSLVESLRRAGKPADAATRVSINIYGREYDRDEVGRELSKKDLFLQHPDDCRVGIKYDNPHILRLDGMDETDTEDEEDVNEEVSETTPERDEGFGETMAEVFNSLQRGDHLTELGGSETLIRTLYRHQGEALDFMIQRETGNISEDKYRLWQPKSVGRGQLYCHVITGNEQQEQPDESGGGILADEMGMGKSLTTLVLTAKTLREARQWVEETKALPGASLAKTPSRATLVIVPSRVLINTWEREIDDHLNGGMKMMRYHGRSRKELVSNIDRYDIVITTYNTLAKEHDAKILGKGQSPLHDFAWYRVVLDEAHMIRRRSTTFHRAVVELRARSRWCLSGTPIQNSLGDLGSLLAFLQLKPFHDPRNFSHWIANPFGVRATKRKAIERLTYLLEAVCLRRTIERVNLPGQRSELRRVQFTPEERAKYELTRKDMKRFIHQQAGEYNQQAETFGMFQVFLQLRSFCNHGTYQPRFSWAKRNLLEDELDPVCSMTRDSLNRCSGCRQPLPVMPHGRRPKGSRYRGHIPTASNQRNRSGADYLNADGHSSKMRVLISDVQRDIGTTKSIIFSCWTRTLDLIAKHLKVSSIEFERIDGKTPTSQRQKILDKFDGTRAVPVLIMTTGTGAFGLNLKSVNRVFIVEPQWNPSVESQAVARAIRLGQEQQVLVTRYLVENSIEEAMCSQQTQKLKISQMDFRKDLEASAAGDEGTSDYPSAMQ
ncbi:SNF2 family N-terminal domain-containing protein [Aspergillus pseudonomiae]|nr:SNF2 family N-terminal domain-containing protein [Aspergillus pseudonomiae]